MKQKKPKETHLYKIVKDPKFTPFEAVTITSTQSAADYCRKFYTDDIDVYESVFILLLNRANITIAFAKISQGGITGSIIDNTLICKYAIDCLAKAVIICHNHPSGNLQPSNNDIKVTEKLRSALNLLDISLLDHIIFSKEGYYSFKEETNIL